MVKNRIKASCWTIAQLVTAGCLVAGCDDLTRFEQERYECGSNPYGLVEIDFRDFDEGKETTVVFNDETVIMPIVESSDTNFILASPGLIIRVDRRTSNIRLTRGMQYRNLKCIKSKFRM